MRSRSIYNKVANVGDYIIFENSLGALAGKDIDPNQIGGKAKRIADRWEGSDDQYWYRLEDGSTISQSEANKYCIINDNSGAIRKQIEGHDYIYGHDQPDAFVPLKPQPQRSFDSSLLFLTVLVVAVMIALTQLH